MSVNQNTISDVLVAEKPQLNVPGAEYPVYGRARNGGPYNSHLVSTVVIATLAGCGIVSIWLAAWIVLCLVTAVLLDRQSLRRNIVLRAIPGQLFLYAQVALRAMWDALPYFLFAYVVYVCVAPLWLQVNLAISSFVLLYGCYMVVRLYWLLRYLWVLYFHWENSSLRTFAVHEANLKSRGAAIRHVLWAYFLGNIGLVVRCSSQVITVAGFEHLRMALGMDLTRHSLLNEHLVLICVVATTIWLATFWFAIKRALLIYYRMHRTFHKCRPLYDSVHSIHHRGVLPTPLDSGTISPAEFIITEMAIPAWTIVPNWYWVLGQIILAAAGHWPSHDAGTRLQFPRHHLAHHRYFTVNYGLSPAEDTRFGTLYVEPDSAAVLDGTGNAICYAESAGNRSGNEA